MTIAPTRARRSLAAAGLSLLLLAMVGAPPASALPPTVTVQSVSEIGWTSAKVEGQVNPEGKPTQWRIEYITEAVYQRNLAESRPGFEGATLAVSGTTTGTVSRHLEHLATGTTYRSRLVATNEDGEAEAATPPFTPPFSTPTGTTAPGATTGAVDHLAATHAQLHGTVDPAGEKTLYWFEYGTADCGTSACQAAPLDMNGHFEGPGEGTGAFAIAQQVDGLAPQTTYHYRLVARNSFATTHGADQTFTTPAAAGPPAPCPNEEARQVQHSAFLGDCRAYEMVSPPDKSGGNVIPDSGRTRAAAGGGAVGFISLAPFAGAEGSGVTTDYVARRDALPGTQGWSTHAITPPQQSNTLEGLLGSLEPKYEGEFTPDLGAAVFLSSQPLTQDPGVGRVRNLYLRDDVLSPGPGHYTVITGCPRCAEPGGEPLPPPPDQGSALADRPVLTGLSGDASRAAFESAEPLTADTPSNGLAHLFEWSGAEGVRLAGRIPSGTATSCDDEAGPACVAADVSVPADGGPVAHDGGTYRFPHVLSDGTDGHSRLFFTRPTNETNTASAPQEFAGQLFVREDGRRTMKLDVPDPGAPASSYRSAQYWDASTDGERAFFTTKQALTEDSPASEQKLYMWQTTADPQGGHLTLVSLDGEPADGIAAVQGVIGASADGSYVYFLAKGQLVSGAPILNGALGVYLWHQGSLSYVGNGGETGQAAELLSSGANLVLNPRLARVSADGRHLLFATDTGSGLTGQDHGSCSSSTTTQLGCTELYLYSAEGSTPTEPSLQCVSCRPDGAPATISASDMVRELNGGGQASWHTTNAMLTGPDGHLRVFFSTAEPLVPADTDGVSDAYEYDATTEEVHLLSSGTSADPSWFLDASADGTDAFFVTAQRLLGWDTDGNYDLYDAREGGGLPEPQAAAAICQGDACQGPSSGSPGAAPVGTGQGLPGNPPTASHPRCPKGRHAVKVGGRRRCVKHHKRHRHHHHHRTGKRTSHHKKGAGR